MEIPVSVEYTSPPLIDMIFVYINMAIIILISGTLAFFIAVVLSNHFVPKKKWAQIFLSFGFSILIPTIVLGVGYLNYDKADWRGSKEVIKEESIAAETKRVYGYEMGKRVKNEFPNQVREYPEYWYEFKAPDGKQHVCEVVYVEKPNLESMDALGWESAFLQVPKDIQEFRAKDTKKFPARLICEEDGTEPKKI